ncbi:MAG: DUF2610 domain-containing protein [Rickettsiales bacterium]|nr:DUF2610 domain-containing protein [Rickettsiales bacterium]
MVHKFTTNCNFRGQKLPVTFYVGNPAAGNHPLDHQAKWLSKEKGGNIPREVMDAFTKLKAIADNGRISFEELCKYVVDELNSANTLESDFNKASQLSSKNDKK